MSKATIGIVGGGGYVGSSLAKHLSSKYDVKVLDVKEPAIVGSKIDFIQCDVRKRKDVEEGLKNVDLVINTAIIQIPQITEQKRLGYEVNIIGTQNVCEVANENPKIKGLLLTSSWHTIGERGVDGVVDEEFGFRPDKVEDRARLYALSKVAQESIVRFYDEMSSKVFGAIRMGTVLGEGMPKKTAANIFIENAIAGKPITPFKQSMYRPMFYVDLGDILQAYEAFTARILSNSFSKPVNSLDHIVNVYYPESITIFDLAQIVRDSVIKYSGNKIVPQVNVIDTGEKILHAENEGKPLKANVTKAATLLNLKQLKHPRESIEQLVKNRLNASS